MMAALSCAHLEFARQQRQHEGIDVRETDAHGQHVQSTGSEAGDHHVGDGGESHEQQGEHRGGGHLQRMPQGPLVPLPLCGPDVP